MAISITECDQIESVENSHVNKLKGSQRGRQEDVPGWTFHDIDLGPWLGGMPSKCYDKSWAGLDSKYKGDAFISTKLKAQAPV